jgi:hypothetical protein
MNSKPLLKLLLNVNFSFAAKEKFSQFHVNIV